MLWLFVGEIMLEDNTQSNNTLTKYNEIHPEGLHDQSIFGVEWEVVIPALCIMKMVNYKEDGKGNSKFTTQSGELTFLNIVHYLWNFKDPAFVYVTKHPLMGYNTPEEVKKIQQAIQQLK